MIYAIIGLLALVGFQHIYFTYHISMMRMGYAVIILHITKAKTIEEASQIMMATAAKAVSQ